MSATTMPNATTSAIVTPFTHYGYVPTLWICCTFVALFSLTTAIHLAQAIFIKPRVYWLIPTTAMCGLGEAVGWSGRLWSSKNPELDKPFLMQISTTIIAPVFLTAALYTILGIMIEIIGHEYSRLKPKTYLKIFVTADVVALVVQAAGGGIASTANTSSGSANGAHIMLAGIFLQMAGMLCYTVLAIEFLLRIYLQRPFIRPGQSSSTESSEKAWKGNGLFLTPRLSLMVLGLALATMFVFVRTIYRTIELIGGWHGHIIRTQIFFNVLDATPITLALYTLNVLSPAWLLRKESTDMESQE